MTDDNIVKETERWLQNSSEGCPYPFLWGDTLTISSFVGYGAEVSLALKEK